MDLIRLVSSLVLMVFKFKRITSEAPFPFYRVRALDCESFSTPEACRPEIPVVMLELFAGSCTPWYLSRQLPAETQSAAAAIPYFPVLTIAAKRLPAITDR